MVLDCSQSSIFPRDHRDIVRLTVNGSHLDFQMYRGGGRRGLYSSRGRGVIHPRTLSSLRLVQDDSP